MPDIFEPTAAHRTFLRSPEIADSPIWNNTYYCLFETPYDFKDIQNALNIVVSECDGLRVRPIYDSGKLSLTIEPFQKREYPIKVFATKERFLEWANEEAGKSVFHAMGMWKAFLIEIEGRRGLFGVVHHGTSDGLTAPLLCHRVCRALHGIKSTTVSYTEHLNKYAMYRRSPRFERDREFWKHKLSGEEIPYVFDRGFSGRCSNQYATWDSSKMADFCAERGISEAVVMYSCTAIALLLLSQKEKISIGIPVLGRATKLENEALGLYMNVVPLLCANEPISFLDFCSKLQLDLFDLFRHQAFAGPDIQSAPLFDVTVDYTQYPEDFEFEGIPFSGPFMSSAVEFHFWQSEKSVMKSVIRAKDDLFFSNSCEVLSSAIKAVLDHAIAHPNEIIRDIPLIDCASRDALDQINNTNAETPDASVYATFDATSRKRTAYIRYENSVKTLNDLREDAEKIDHYLGSEAKTVIGLVCDRGYLELAAVYGIVRGGNAYMPLPPSYPRERLEKMIEVAGCKTILCERRFKGVLPATCIEDVLENAAPKSPLPIRAKADDILYVLFTSGSTGVPKGVPITNKGAANRIRWMAEKYFSPETIVMRKTPYSFDVSVWEIFAFGMFGFSLFVLPPDKHFSHAAIAQSINEGGVTDVHFVPTLFEEFLTYCFKRNITFPKLKNIFLTGEIVKNSQVKLFEPLYDQGIRLHNLYGPTECSDVVTFYDCPREIEGQVPIGTPLDNCELYVLDSRLREVPFGVAGQIAVSGICLSPGYLNDPEKTKEAFVEGVEIGKRVYLTGDLGYFRHDGVLMILGRNDQQVKINGQRVELSDIENTLAKFAGIESCCVLLLDGKLTCFYKGDATKEQLREESRKALPRHMLPQFWVKLEAVPLTSSGKIDRQSLAAYSFPKKELVLDERAATVEERISHLFERVLKTNDVGENDDFFDLGGTSLAMMQILSDDLFASISASSFMESPTVSGLANKIYLNQSDDALSLLYKGNNPTVSIVCFPFAGGDASGYTEWVKTLKKRQASVNLYFVPWQDDYSQSLEAIVRLDKTSGMIFYAHCAGSCIALRMLQGLEKRGAPVPPLFVGGNIPPRRPCLGINPWRFVAKRKIRALLSNSGLKASDLSTKKGQQIMTAFMHDTDQYFHFFQGWKVPVNTRATVIMATGDALARDEKRASTVWKQYVRTVQKTIMLATDNHYFHSQYSDYVIDEIIQESHQH